MIGVKIDFVGLLVSILLLGIRYPHYVVLAALINFLGFSLAAFLLPEGVESIIISGVFSAATANNEASLPAKAVLLVSPAFANYAAARLRGLPGLKNAAGIFSPFAVLDNAFAVINLRLAAVYFLYHLILLFF